MLSSISPKLADLLKCNCGGGVCLGTFIPALAAKCAAGAELSMAISMTAINQMPNIVANTTGLFAIVQGRAEIGATGVGNLLVLNATAGVVLPAEALKFDGWDIKGEVHATSGTLVVQSSQIGPIPAAALDTLWRLALILVFEGELNKLAQKGISLPNIPDVTVQNPTLLFGDRTLQLCCNLVINV